MSTNVSQDMVQAAVEIRKRAYAPYSRFLVGAAIRCEDGRIFTGCNVENAAYPEGICAEGGAISAMVAAGGRKITEVIVCCDSAIPCTPCGGCRQKLREFATPNLTIRMVSKDGQELFAQTLEELLPHSFGPESLNV
ncbi:MAG: cytidine deaminase [Acetobacter sp.]|jgi:cytidine deaminase